MVTENTTNKDTYIGDGSTTTWPLTMDLGGVIASEIKVYTTVIATGVSTLITSNYTVDIDAATVEYPISGDPLTPVPATLEVLLVRTLTTTQAIDYKNQGTLPAETIEQGLDRTVMMINQLQEQLDRTLQADISEDTATVDNITATAQAAADAAAASETAAAASETAAAASEAAAAASEAAAAAAVAGVSSITTTFDNSDLTAGVLTETHNYGLSAPYALSVTVIDNNGKIVEADEITMAANSFTVDLSSFGTISGTWAIFYGANAVSDGGFTEGTNEVHLTTIGDQVGIGAAVAAAKLEINNASGESQPALEIDQADSAETHIRLTGDPANGSPTDGDLWYDGASLNFYDGTTEKDLIASNRTGFLVKPTSDQTNIAVGSDVTVIFGTEVFDDGGNFASNTYTAPKTGVYMLSFNVCVDDIPVACTDFNARLIVNSVSYYASIDPAGFALAVNFWSLGSSVIVKMTAGQTAHVVVNQTSGASQVDILSARTNFSGILIA